MAASVAHDGDGLEGARFCAAAIAQAFVAKSIDEIVETAMGTLDPNSTYAKVCRAVIDRVPSATVVVPSVVTVVVVPAAMAVPMSRSSA